MTEITYQEVNDAQPQVIDHIVGQKNVVARVKVALESCWNDGVRFPHCLLTGPAGLGKTQISQIIAAEMGVEIKEQLAQNLGCPAALRGFLLEGQEKDVLLIDEIHELSRTVQTTLYRALENGKIFLEGAKKHSHTIQLSNFTLLGATTDPHLLLTPLRDRFKMVLPFDYYSHQELEHILRHRCKQLNWYVEEEVFSEVAQRGRNTPRIALRLLESAKRTSRSENSEVITFDHLLRTCVLEGIDLLGLTKEDRTYLTILREQQKPMRLNIIALRMGLPAKTITEIIEPYLIRIGLISKDDQGRFLTPQGMEYICQANH